MLAVEACLEAHIRHLSLANPENAQDLGLHASKVVTSAEAAFCATIKAKLESGK